MTGATGLLVAVGLLAVGTFAFRVAGPMLHARVASGVAVSPRAARIVAVAATVLLTSVVATAALLEGPDFAGFARPAGVAVGGVLAWRRAPFVVVVLAAAVIAAGLRQLGVP